MGFLTQREIKNFERIILTSNLKSTHQAFLNLISKLYTAGLGYNDLIKDEDLIFLNRKIVNKYSDKYYPYLQHLVNFISTRDIRYNSTGRTISINYFDPLICYDYCCEIQNLSRTKYFRKELAGCCYALLVLSRAFEKVHYNKLPTHFMDNVHEYLQNKNYRIRNDNDSIYLLKRPSLLYEIACASSKALKKYCELLQVTRYPVFDSYFGYRKTTVLFPDLKVFLTEYNNYKTVRIEYYKQLYNQHNLKLESGLKLRMNKSQLQKLNLEVQSFFSANTYHRYCFTNIKGFPFYSIFQNSDSVSLLSNLDMLPYELVCSVLYTHNPVYLHHIKDDQRKRLITIDKDLSSELRKQLKSSENYQKRNPISSPLRSSNAGLHFEQIERVKVIVDQISRVGIKLNLKVLDVLLSEIQNKRDKILNNDLPNRLLYSENAQFLRFTQDNEIIPGKKIIRESDKLQYQLDMIDKIKTKIHQHIPIDQRIRGTFFTHNSKTHRMTCKKFNLQGIPKVLRQRMFIAPRNYKLISADVSGQDIMVAANMALRVYNDSLNFPNDDERRPKLEGIISTINKLKTIDQENSHKPIDYIKNKICQNKDILGLTWSKDEIRDAIKIAVYTRLYGGGPKTITKSKLIEYLPEVISMMNQSHRAVGIHFALFGGLPKLIQKKFTPEQIVQITSNIKDLFNAKQLVDQAGSLNQRNDIQVKAIKNPNVVSTTNTKDHNRETNVKVMKFPSNINYETLNSISEFISENDKGTNNLLDATIQEAEMLRDFINNQEIVYNCTSEVLEQEYSGIFEAFEYYQKYLNETRLTYPTLLGWQTVIDDLKPHLVRSKITRSKSYVIQASGAEFLREWLIQLSLHRLYVKKFKIVNIIHDQIILECHNDVTSEMQVELTKSAEKAAQIVGIDPKTLHLQPTILCG